MKKSEKIHLTYDICLYRESTFNIIVACNIFCHIRHNLQIPCLNDINQQNDKNNESFGFFFQFPAICWCLWFLSLYIYDQVCSLLLNLMLGWAAKPDYLSIYTLNTFSGKQFKVVMDLYHCMVSVIDLNRKTIF